MACADQLCFPVIDSGPLQVGNGVAVLDRGAAVGSVNFVVRELLPALSTIAVPGPGLLEETGK